MRGKAACDVAPAKKNKIESRAAGYFCCSVVLLVYRYVLTYGLLWWGKAIACWAGSFKFMILERILEPKTRCDKV